MADALEEPSEPDSGARTVTEAPGAMAARRPADSSRPRRREVPAPRGSIATDTLLALLTREHDRRAVRDAAPGEVVVHFAARPAELHPPWPDGAPTAVLVELPDTGESSLERALETLQRTAPTVPVWAYIPPELDAVREVVRLAARRLIVNVVANQDDLRAQLRQLLRDSRAWSETAAIWGVLREWVGPEAHDLLGACIDASAGRAAVADVARQLNESPRALERQVSRLGLPATHRMLSLCRLLRAMHRLDLPGSNVKTVASELGYPSSHSLAKQLHRHTGLTMSRLREGGGFVGLAALVRTELLIARNRPRQHQRDAAHGR